MASLAKKKAQNFGGVEADSCSARRAAEAAIRAAAASAAAADPRRAGPSPGGAARPHRHVHRRRRHHLHQGEERGVQNQPGHLVLLLPARLRTKG